MSVPIPERNVDLHGSAPDKHEIALLLIDLFTANDAYVRDFNLFVPTHCTVSNTKRENDSALRLMKKFLKLMRAGLLA